MLVRKIDERKQLNEIILKNKTKKKIRINESQLKENKLHYVHCLPCVVPARCSRKTPSSQDPQRCREADE